jgi:F-type H+-transporting ATPase subunit gamma
VKHPLTEVRHVKRVALVVVTSDKGLCGVMNAAVLRGADSAISQLSLPKESIDVYAFGKKATDYFERRGYSLRMKVENISDEVSISSLESVTKLVTESFEAKKIDKVLVLYTSFKSTFEQFPVTEIILPLTVSSIEEIVQNILPEKGAFASLRKDDAKPTHFYTIEPSPESVLNALIPRLASVLMYHALLESKASEHSARMVAMKNASDKSRDLSKSLTRTFNKVRQAMITREVSEIVGGIEAMAVQ